MRFLGVLVFCSLLSTGCFSPQGMERVQDLRERMNEIQTSIDYSNGSRIEEMTQMRNELVALLISEGKIQEEFIGVPGHPEAKEEAKRLYTEAKALAERELAFTDKELRQKWNMMNWAWDQWFPANFGHRWSDRQVWNGVKTFFPAIWPYTACEQIVCFIGDLVGAGWNTEEVAIKIPPMSGVEIANIDALIAGVGETSVEERANLAQGSCNVHVVMTYKLTGTVQAMNAHRIYIRNTHKLPGEQKGIFSNTQYQVIWDSKAQEILSLLTNEAYSPSGTLGRPYLNSPTVFADEKTNTTEVLVTLEVQGYIPFDRLSQAMDDLAVDQSTESDQLKIILTPLDPSEQQPHKK